MQATDSGEPCSAPPFPVLHSGPVLVCGSAACLLDDYQQARDIYPAAPVIAVNDAAGAIRAAFLFSLHPRKFPGWIAAQKRLHDEFTVHSSATRHVLTKMGKRPEMPWVDYWWSGVAHGGTSGWCGRRLARFLGFDLAVLCGIPLEAGGYFNGSRASKQNRSGATMAHYRHMVETDTAMHDGVVSMSGWTKEFFGAW